MAQTPCYDQTGLAIDSEGFIRVGDATGWRPDACWKPRQRAADGPMAGGRGVSRRVIYSCSFLAC